METFQDQMMQVILPRFIEGMNQFNARLKTLEESMTAETAEAVDTAEPQGVDKDQAILVSQHELAITTIKDILKNQLKRIAILDDIKIQLDDAIDRINSIEARLADAKPVRRRRKPDNDTQVAPDNDTQVEA